MKKLLLTALLLTTAACNRTAAPSVAQQGQPAAVAQAEALAPEQLGELGGQIRKDPARAQQLLAQHGLTEESFEQAVRKVAEDPAASKKYADAFKKAGV
ncbi:MAG TPA: hypothetical protein VF618_01040 [Thermoanaerobaculia bacterium]